MFPTASSPEMGHLHRRDQCWLLSLNETAWGFKLFTQDQTTHSNPSITLLEQGFDPNVSHILAKISQPIKL